MLSNWIKGTLVGGVILYFWGMISWMVLPWHTATLHPTPNETAVKTTIEQSVTEHGVYIIPDPTNFEADAQSKKMSSLFAFMVIQPKGFTTTMGQMLMIQIVNQLLVAGLICFLLLQAAGLSYRKKILFTAAAGLLAGVSSHLPYWNWWQFPTTYTVVLIVEITIGFTLAGIGIGKVIKA